MRRYPPVSFLERCFITQTEFHVVLERFYPTPLNLEQIGVDILLGVFGLTVVVQSMILCL